MDFDDDLSKWIVLKKKGLLSKILSWYIFIAIASIIVSFVVYIVLSLFGVSSSTKDTVNFIILLPVGPPVTLIEFLLRWEYAFFFWDIVCTFLILYVIVSTAVRLIFFEAWRVLLKPWVWISSIICLVVFSMVTRVSFFSSILSPVQSLMDSPFALLEFFGITSNNVMNNIRERIYDMGFLFTWIAIEAIGFFVCPLFIARKGRYEIITGGIVYDMFQEVHKKACSSYRGFPRKLKLYYDPDEDLNACAFSSNKIAISDGLISYMAGSEKEGVENIAELMYKGVVAHELGHIIHKDVIGGIIANINIFIMTFIVFIPYMVYSFFFGSDEDSQSAVGCLVKLFLLIFVLIGAALNLLARISNYAAYILGGRKDEYLADRFCVNIGYGEGLSHFFIVNLDIPDGGFSDPHPSSVKRLLKVFDRMATIPSYDKAELMKLWRYTVYSANELLKGEKEIPINVKNELECLVAKCD